MYIFLKFNDIFGEGKEVKNNGRTEAERYSC